MNTTQLLLLFTSRLVKSGLPNLTSLSSVYPAAPSYCKHFCRKSAGTLGQKQADEPQCSLALAERHGRKLFHVSQLFCCARHAADEYALVIKISGGKVTGSGVTTSCFLRPCEREPQGRAHTQDEQAARNRV